MPLNISRWLNIDVTVVKTAISYKWRINLTIVGRQESMKFERHSDTSRT